MTRRNGGEKMSPKESIASWLFHSNNRWWVAGLAGGLVGVVWNYAASTTFVWRRRRKS